MFDAISSAAGAVLEGAKAHPTAAVAATSAAVSAAGWALSESQATKDARYIEPLAEGKCPKVEDRAATAGALSRVQDNQFTRGLVCFFNQCLAK